jgi:glycerophosphoryl diester phosphodiesterase
MNRLFFTFVAFVALTASHALAVFPTLTGEAPLVIGHRGASGYRPEHTLAAYELAILQGADYIEPDLVSTKDGVLIARHEPMLGSTTDVASHPEFAAYKTTKMLDGFAVEDWFASDFTLAEIKTLRAIQPRPNRPQEFNGLYEIPTLEEVINLAQQKSMDLGRTIGIYPETKHPTFHDTLPGGGLSLEEPLLANLSAAGWNNAAAPVFIQSFEVSNLQELNGLTDVKLVQLVDAYDVADDGGLILIPPYERPYDWVVNSDPRTFGDLVTPTGLDFIKTYADGVGPWKTYLLKTVADGVDRTGDGMLTINDRMLMGDTGVIADAHDRGLLVHTWTFRNDASQYGFANAMNEYDAYFALGVDGVFSDFPDTAVAAVPEPASALLSLVAGIGIFTLRRRKAGK